MFYNKSFKKWILLISLPFFLTVNVQLFSFTDTELADNAFQEGNYENAIKYYKKNLDSDNTSCTESCVLFFFAHDLYKKSAKSNSRRLCGRSDNLIQIGHSYLALGNYDKAIDYYEKTVDNYKLCGYETLDKDIFVYIGHAYFLLDKKDKAAEYFKKGYSGDKIGDAAYSLKKVLSLSSIFKGKEKTIDYVASATELIPSQSEAKSDLTYDIAMAYYKISGFDKSIVFYKKYIEYQESIGKSAYLGSAYTNLGVIYAKKGKFDSAIEYYNKSLAVLGRIARPDKYERESMTIAATNIGAIYSDWGNYGKSLEFYNKALTIIEESGDKQYVAQQLVLIGKLYRFLGQYDKDIACCNRALSLMEEFVNERRIKFPNSKDTGYMRLENNQHISYALTDLSRAYKAKGDYKKQIELLDRALSVATLKYYDLTEEKKLVSVCLNNLAVAYSHQEQYDRAVYYYNKILSISNELKDKSSIAFTYRILGTLHVNKNEYNKAEDYYEKALSIREELKDKHSLSDSYYNLASLYDTWGKKSKALDYYKKNLDIQQELQDRPAIAQCLNNIGITYHEMKEYSKAIEYLLKAINIYEEIRLTAFGETRRDYLAKQITTYQWLVSSYIRNEDYDKAMNTVEFSSAKYLAEQLGEKLGSKKTEFVDIRKYQKKIKGNSAILSFSNAGSYNGIASIYVDDKVIEAFETDEKLLINDIIGKYSNRIYKTNERLRGFKIKNIQKENKEQNEKNEIININSIINFYRYLISQPVMDNEDKVVQRYISSVLYRILFKNFEKNLQGKEELVIIPGGILAFVPFETLTMPDGRYLVEKYQIKYVQSLTVNEIIEKRNYSASRKPMIAFGGGVYDRINYNKEMIENEQQLESLKLATHSAINRGEGVRDAYFKMGFGKWNNLPGTLAEVKAIKKIDSDMVLYTGREVDESVIKTLSKKGDLKNFKVIHFATHGLVVPEMPELSALVLSQYQKEKNAEDGYLRMQEIAGLDINADFVNLSACETGLGKIYGGEGVVGLTQSFLIAGANGLSVSLWQVADTSTMEFMAGLYKKVKESGESYDKAITEMKREFIRSEKYSQPFYWAPFVYYGK